MISQVSKMTGRNALNHILFLGIKTTDTSSKYQNSVSCKESSNANNCLVCCLKLDFLRKFQKWAYTDKKHFDPLKQIVKQRLCIDVICHCRNHLFDTLIFQRYLV